MRKSCPRWKIWLSVIIGVIVCLVTAWVFIHRRLIRALIRNEEKPECPHWLPQCMREESEIDDFDDPDDPSDTDDEEFA